MSKNIKANSRYPIPKAKLQPSSSKSSFILPNCPAYSIIIRMFVILQKRNLLSLFQNTIRLVLFPLRS